MQRILSRTFPSTSSNVSTVTTFMVDRRPPPDLGKWANFKRFIWNRDKRTFCNRTCASWCKVVWFYMLFLMLILGLFFALILGSTEYIRNNFKDPWIHKTNLVCENPGVGFVPNILRGKSPLLWYSFKSQDDGNAHYKSYVRYLDRRFKVYDQAEKHRYKFSNCSDLKHADKPCIFLRKDLGPCGQSEFGYAEMKPCVYIKLNKLPGWRPRYYNGDDLPEDMPTELKKVIKNDPVKEKLWIHCEGIYPPDNDHIGKISYYPEQAIMGYYFPYDGHKNYLTPLVAVKIDNIKRGYVCNLRCSVWAKNIHYVDPKTHSAFIQLYLSID